MALEIKIPSPGESITEVEIAEWLVQDGDYVEKDQAIAEVDSDKETAAEPLRFASIVHQIIEAVVQPLDLQELVAVDGGGAGPSRDGTLSSSVPSCIPAAPPIAAMTGQS